jgi:hypothetical protein
MQHWMLVSAPLAATLYFLTFPAQFRVMLDWVGFLIQ